jgi:superfamily II DNA/RNA helicase
LIPVLSRIVDERIAGGKTACVIAVPTHELCQQIASVLVSIDPTVSLLVAYGKPDKGFGALLRRNPTIIVGTGGRLAVLARKGHLDMSNVKILVIDEFDALADRTYLEEMSPLISSLSPHTQIIASGATCPPALERIMQSFEVLKNIQRINAMADNVSTPSNIRHKIMKVPDSLILRSSVVATLLSRRTQGGKVIIFASSAAEVKGLVHHPALLSKARAVHGQLPQEERKRLIDLFRTDNFPVLICTDLGARGLDFPEVDLVISMRPPQDHVTYIHRAGRTGRGTRSGTSLILFSGPERDRVDEILKHMKVPHEVEPSPSSEVQKDTLMEQIVDEAGRFVLPNSGGLSAFVKELSVSEQVTLVSKCLNALMGDSSAMYSEKPSMLSGVPGFAPVLLIDPNRDIVKSRVDVEKIFNDVGVKSFGMVAFSESGYVVDLSRKDVEFLREHGIHKIRQTIGVEAVAVEKIPKISTDVGSLDSHRRKSPIQKTKRKRK